MALKTHKGIAKRFKVTKSGKLKYASCGRSHLLSSKKSNRKRRLRRPRILEKSGHKSHIRSLLPYS